MICFTWKAIPSTLAGLLNTDLLRTEEPLLYDTDDTEESLHDTNTLRVSENLLAVGTLQNTNRIWYIVTEKVDIEMTLHLIMPDHYAYFFDNRYGIDHRKKYLQPCSWASHQHQSLVRLDHPDSWSLSHSPQHCSTWSQSREKRTQPCKQPDVDSLPPDSLTEESASEEDAETSLNIASGSTPSDLMEDPKPLSPSEYLKLFTDQVVHGANSLGIQMNKPPKSSPDPIFGPIDADTWHSNFLPLNSALMDIVKACWGKPASLPPTSRKLEGFYKVQARDSQFLLHHPTPNSMTVETAQFQSKNRILLALTV
ncbi:uncharacterized protein LOC128346053 isoform X1 [Hemicordylus capensis]|uniref:uncharacterized protein LOC128346053 isoform X1 n=1 Tax=Hemicordylus capensis TaxID=884348 RepID=UPI0023049280|nr:uncharacterized protein LOC128346053 isoform X1 [Hemicordylus capensis]XP_053154893.1 uncharacterized protein LOC128346053 isoform X1 [Hemicordylus capensis]